MHINHSATIRFGVFELHPDSGELLKRGQKVKLQEQPFQVLRVLLEHPGAVVTREELQQRIWPSDTFVDFDHGVYNAVQKLREALGDSAENPRFIETLARRGYRFSAQVNETKTLGITQGSIAVLPLTNMSTDSENEFLADGITEEIINMLGQLRDLRVVARSSAFSFKGKHVDPRIVGEQLKVQNVLEGSLRTAEGHLRITVRLVNAADGFQLWSERYDREMKDVFAIQDEIARSVAERLSITLSVGEKEPIARAGTRNLEAYQLYLKGRALLYRRGAAILVSAECFDRAVALDPDYAVAWAGIADSYTTVGYYGLARPEASMPKAMEAARRSVTLGPLLAESHNALAMACLMGSWDTEEAEREFLRALELNPRYVQARDWYGLFSLHFSQGRLDEGVAQAKLALDFDPLSSYAHAIYGLACAVANKHAEAVQASRRAVELDAESYLACMILQSVLHQGGWFEESVAVGEKALAMSGRHSWSMAVLAVTFADWGKPDYAESVYAEMLARSHRQYAPSALLAVAASAAEKENDAIRHAREALEIHDPDCEVYFSRYVPYSARLYAYERFREMLLELEI